MSLLASRRRHPRLVVLCALMVLAATPSCGTSGTYVWVAAVAPADRAAPEQAEYVIRDGDQLAVRVVGQESASASGRVRTDGRLSVPLVGDVLARGRTTGALATEIATRLKVYIVAPAVTVAVLESDAPRVSVLGEVARPGVYPIAPSASVLDVLALAGGLTDYASSDRVFVLRSARASTLRIRFSYERLARGALPDAAFVVRPGDTLVVE